MTEEQERALFLERLAKSLDNVALSEFRHVERIMLTRSMAAVGMDEYPEVEGDPHGERADGDCVCRRCGKEYAVHPLDWRVIGYGNVPFLHILCDGRRVKL